MRDTCIHSTFARLSSVSAIALLAQLATPAMAQTAPRQPVAEDRVGDGNDIVVTARRREESLQDVPISVVAFSQEGLRQNNVASATDLARVSPGLISFEGQAGNSSVSSFSIRGRGTTFGAAAGSVETYFAEVPLSANYGIPQLPPQFFDVASVQVLKGPQGTLFGRSTTGGAILIQPAAPTNEWEGYGRVQLGNYNDLQVEGALNIPVVEDVLAIRLAGQHWKRDGYVSNSATLPQDVQTRLANDPGYVSRLTGFGSTYANGQVRDLFGRTIIDNGTIISSVTGKPIRESTYYNKDTTDLRGTVRFSPGDRFENSTLVTYHRDRNIGGQVSGMLLVRNALGAPVGTEPMPGYGTYTPYISVSPEHPDSHALGIINTTRFEIADGINLRNIFGYISAKGYTNDPYDSDGTPSRTVDGGPARPRKGKQYTNELQLQGTTLNDRLDFTVGGLIDLLREPQDPNNLNQNSTGQYYGPFSPDPVSPNAVIYQDRSQSANVTSRALYASGTLKITDQLSLSGGYRHTWDKVTAKQSISIGSLNQPFVFMDADPTLPGFQQTITKQSKFQGNTYNASLDFKVNQEVLVYAGYRHGFKRGGFNASAFGRFPAAFGPENVDSFSAGAKTRFNLGDVRGHFNIEGFYDKYKGFQGLYLDIDAPTQTLVAVTTNVPKVRYAGFDADLGLNLSAGIDLNVSYSYLDAKILSFPDPTTSAPNPPSLAGNEIPFAAKHQVQASVRFHGDAPGIGEWALTPSLSYRSKYYTLLFNRMVTTAQAAATGPFNDIAFGGQTVPGVLTVDARAELNKIAGSNFDLAFGATNLLNKYYYTGATGTLSFGYQTYSVGAPRMVYGEVSYHF